MNAISNFIGLKLGLCPLPSAASAPISMDKKDLLKTSLDSESFSENTLANDRFFYRWVSRSEWELARRFYKENPGINLNYSEDSPSCTSLSVLIATGEKFKEELEHCLIDREKFCHFIDLILEIDAKKDTPLEFSWPAHKQVLKFLFENNQVKLIYKFFENRISREKGNDLDHAKIIFLSLKNKFENERTSPSNFNDLSVWFSVSDGHEKVPSVWSVYLDLMKETCLEALSDIESDSLLAKRFNYLAKKQLFPTEIYEEIAMKILKKGEDYLSLKKKEQPSGSYEDRKPLKILVSSAKLLPAKFNLKPNVPKVLLIKLTTISLLALQENSKVTLDAELQKKCLSLISQEISKQLKIYPPIRLFGNSLKLHKENPH